MFLQRRFLPLLWGRPQVISVWEKTGGRHIPGRWKLPSRGPLLSKFSGTGLLVASIQTTIWQYSTQVSLQILGWFGGQWGECEHIWGMLFWQRPTAGYQWGTLHTIHEVNKSHSYLGITTMANSNIFCEPRILRPTCWTNQICWSIDWTRLWPCFPRFGSIWRLNHQNHPCMR